ncbi:MAG: M20/M25/M40 family metallo-hydrolase [Candidatus Delongbacteria bacterium]|nr:M20/M25/M40 family metallo-hydrolase [Candidatus Delongbacteria bacterium]
MKENEVVELVKELIKIDSRNPFEIVKKSAMNFQSSRDAEINRFLESKLKETGFKVEKQFVFEDKRGVRHFNLLAEKGKGKSSILFYGHSDTVSSEPWLSLKSALTPREGTVEFQGKKRKALFGLGSNDMKTGLAVICLAFRDTIPEGYKIKVAFGIDEEYYSAGANVLAQSSFMDDVKAIVVPEIGDGPNRFFGHETIGIGRLGRCEFEIDVYGTGGHGAISNDPSFISAAVEASKFAVEFENFRKNYRDIFIFETKEIPDTQASNKIEGSFFISKIDCGKESLSIPSWGRIVIDCTFTPNVTIRNIRKKLKDFIDSLYKSKILKTVIVEGVEKKMKLKLKKRPTPYSEAYMTPADHPFTVFVRRCIGNIGKFRNYNMGYSVADENVFRRYNPETPVLVLGPVGWNSHRADEWAEIESIEKLLELYRDIGMKFGEYCG